MILTNPVTRLVLKAISAFGSIGNQYDSASRRGDQVQKKDSPFVLVACADDGRWKVFQQDFDKPQASFDEMQEACDYANELASNRTDSMVLIGRRPASGINPDSSLAQGTT